jgi:hypothetical protein
VKAKEQGEQSADPAQQQGEQLGPIIGRRVLEALGRRGDGYRTGADAASTRIAASYFLVVGGDGSILASTPELARQD